MRKSVQILIAAVAFSFSAGAAMAEVDTAGLERLGDAWRDLNPYRGNPKAAEVGFQAFTENCAPCHGERAVSPGGAPDLRYLEMGDAGDQWFSERVRNGATRRGIVYMPKFEGILTQEALWSIRTWLESVHQN